MDQHAILDELKLLGYSGTDEWSKVRHLNVGIKTLKLNVLKTQILASASLHSNFEEAVVLHKDVIVQVNAMEPTHNVSEVKTFGNKDKGNGRHKKASNEPTTKHWMT